MKQFESKTDLVNYVDAKIDAAKKAAHPSASEIELMLIFPTDEQYQTVLDELAAEGYDLNDLIKSGKYQFLDGKYHN